MNVLFDGSEAVRYSGSKVLGEAIFSVLEILPYNELLCVLSLQVTHLLESHTYNVAVAQLMIFCNHLKEFKKLSGSLDSGVSS